MIRRKRRLFVLAVLCISLAAVGAYLATRGSEPAQAANELTPAASEAPITPFITTAVAEAENAPGGAPLAEGAQFSIEEAFTPADRTLPSFYRAPAAGGGHCIVTSEGVVSGCWDASRSASPGSVTIEDTIEGEDKKPPFVYGQISAEVAEVIVVVDGVEYQAGLSADFYVFALPDPTMTTDSVDEVTFVSEDGNAITVDGNP